ncbi:MAG: hypothetical protein JNN11_03675 [Candidatus Doudnabacteria bacterium]|nr:hypothetical protein [Candidatus Doudnabacteria bacterium]
MRGKTCLLCFWFFVRISPGGTMPKRHKLPAVVTEVVQCAGLFGATEVRYSYPADFRPKGSGAGTPAHFFLGSHVQGFAPKRGPEKYVNFGPTGIAPGVPIMVYCADSALEHITYVTPRD